MKIAFVQFKYWDIHKDLISDKSTFNQIMATCVIHNLLVNVCTIVECRDKYFNNLWKFAMI